MTLLEKAEQCEQEIFDFHLQDGLLIGKRVDPSRKVLYTNENSGLRTGCLLSALSLKWSINGDLHTRQRAHRVARAVEMLEWATGVPGMTARQYKFMQGPGPDEAGWLQDKWHQCRFYRWLDNVSTDEITWFLLGLADYVNLCAEGEYRRNASAVINRVIGRMLDHGMRIVYADGTVTTWGDCSRATPLEPLYCLHGLAYLKRAELATANERFADAYDEYIRDDQYLHQGVHCYKLGVERGCWAPYDWQLAAPEFELLIKHDKDLRRRDLFKEGLLEMAAAPDANIHPHLCTALLGLGGEDKVRQWLQEWSLTEETSGVDKGWYHWIYWKARSARLIADSD